MRWKLVWMWSSPSHSVRTLTGAADIVSANGKRSDLLDGKKQAVFWWLSTMRTAALIGCAALLALLGGHAPATTETNAATFAHAVRTLRAADTAHMHRVPCSCDEILEEGQAKGALPGSVRAYVTVGAPIVFRFTITVRGVGTLSGEGSGKPKGNPAEPSFSGSMSVTHGTGRYRHAHGKGGFYGTINRSNYAAVMQTTGTLSY